MRIRVMACLIVAGLIAGIVAWGMRAVDRAPKSPSTILLACSVAAQSADSGTTEPASAIAAEAMPADPAAETGAWGEGGKPWAHVIPEPAIMAEPHDSVVFPRRSEPVPYCLIYMRCPADFNRDDVIDDLDVQDFLEAWSTREGVMAPYLDTNGDGWLTDEDVDQFVESFGTPCEFAELQLESK